MTKYFTWETENFTFDSRTLPVFINKIERPLMPPIETPIRTIGTRAGAYVEENRLGVLEITIDLTLMSENTAQHRKQIRELAQNLFFEREGKLIISDEPDRFYKAQISGKFDLDSFAAMGETSISFICGEPFAYNTTENNQLLTSNENLLLYDDIQTLDKWTNWYNNLSINTYTFPSGEAGMRVQMVDVEANPRMRIVSSPDNLAHLTEGETYTMSIIFSHSVKLEKMEMTGLNYYNDAGTETPLGWDTFPTAYNSQLPIENEEDGTKLYTHTFTALQTAGVRLSFGYGLGNAEIDNGTWMNIKQMKIEKGSTYTKENMTIFNDGSYKTYPRLRIVPIEDTTFIRVDNITTAKQIVLNGDFKAWQVYIVDTEKNIIYNDNTGERLMNTLDLSSDFFNLKANAQNILSFEPKEKLSARIYWTERYL